MTRVRCLIFACVLSLAAGCDDGRAALISMAISMNSKGDRGYMFDLPLWLDQEKVKIWTRNVYGVWFRSLA